jgi:hypothetical protein
MAVFLFGPPSRGTPVTALFRVWQHATGGGHTVRVAMGRRRGSVSNREGTIAVVEPPAPRQQEHLRLVGIFRDRALSPGRTKSMQPWSNA